MYVHRGRYAHNAHGVFIILFFSKAAKNFGKREKIGMLPLVSVGLFISSADYCWQLFEGIKEGVKMSYRLNTRGS